MEGIILNLFWVVQETNSICVCAPGKQNIWYSICLILMRNAKEKRKKDLLGNEILPCPLSHLSQKRKSWIDVFIESVGTDGARTRSFRLDRAVLWPIELQSQGNKGYSRKLNSFLFLRIRYFWRTRGYRLMVDWRIIGPSWIWTSVDILPTNLQSVPINRSGIDPGRIHF